MYPFLKAFRKFQEPFPLNTMHKFYKIYNVKNRLYFCNLPF